MRSRELFSAGHMWPVIQTREEEDRLQLLREAHAAGVILYRTSEGYWATSGASRLGPLAAAQMTAVISEGN